MALAQKEDQGQKGKVAENADLAPKVRWVVVNVAQGQKVKEETVAAEAEVVAAVVVAIALPVVEVAKRPIRLLREPYPACLCAADRTLHRLFRTARIPSRYRRS